jgi:hypothetical protein
LTDTIRKLLRLAQRGGNASEAQLARARAEELMERYNVIVTVDDDARLRIPGVTGVYWREQLLFVASRTWNCRALQSTRTPIVAILAGEKVDVVAAHELYRRLCRDFIVAGIREFPDSWFTRVWSVVSQLPYIPERGNYLTAEELEVFARERERVERLLLAAPPGYRDRSRADRQVFDRSDGLAINAFWFQVFLNAAIDGIKISAGTPSPEELQRPYAGRAAEMRDDERPKPKTTGEEIAAITGEAVKLGGSVGPVLVRQLIERANQRGMVCGRNAVIIERRVLRLTAKSSWLPPPPEPTRFNSLEYDELPTAAKVPEPVRQIDID